MEMIRRLRWQISYVVFCAAYFPVIFFEGLFFRKKRFYQKLNPLGRRFLDQWGFPAQRRMALNGLRPIWIHVSSGGEWATSSDLLKKWCGGGTGFLFSSSSYDVHRLLVRDFGQGRVFFAPWDLKAPARWVLKALKPRALVFVQFAYFPILLQEAQRLGIPTILINGLFGRNVHFGDSLVQRALAFEFYHRLDWLSVPDEENHRAALSLGIPPERLVITGDLAADLSHAKLSWPQRQALRAELGLSESDEVFLVGSTHPREQPLLEEAFRLLKKASPGIRFIVAPRWIHEASGIFARFAEAGWRVVRRSEFLSNDSHVPSDYDILLLDTFGELGHLLAAANVAYVGASIIPLNERRAGHNIMQPLAQGVIPVFGPHMNWWRHVTEPLLKLDPTLQVDSAQALAHKTAEILKGCVLRQAIENLADELLQRQAGAVARTLDFLMEKIRE